MAKLRWTSEAQNWLKDIHDYIAQDAPESAAEVTLGIYKKAQVLTRYPRVGYKHKDDSEGEIRILLYGHYRIAYLIKDEDTIDVLGVFHGAMDIERYLH